MQGSRQRPFPYFAFVGLFLGWAGWGTPSFGQVTSPVISPPPPGDVIPDNVPADTELGIPLGSFRLYPTLDVRAGYDTNVFATPATATGSAYEAIRPSLDVRSDWNNHMLNFGAYGAFGFYNSATSQNYQNFGFNTDGRFDIYRDWYVTASAAFTGTTEALGTPDVAQAQAPIGRLCGAPQPWQCTSASTGCSTRPTPAPRACAIRITASSTRTRFPPAAGTAICSASHCGPAMNFAKASMSGCRAPSINAATCSNVNIAGQQRDSDGWSVTGGSTLDLGGISKLEGFVGYSQQNYFSAGVTTGAVVFGLGGAWNGYQPLVCSALRRSIHQ